MIQMHLEPLVRFPHNRLTDEVLTLITGGLKAAFGQYRWAIWRS